MPDTRISDLTVLTSPAAGDLIPIVDISDTTMAASGTTKRVTQSVLLASVQPLDATLTALAGLTIAADSLAIGTGADAFTQTTFAANTLPARASTGSLQAKPITDFGLSLIDDAADSNARTTLGLGTLATQSGTFSGTSSGTNTGDVTLAGENYLSISAQAVTANAVNLSGTHVTGTLADARFPATLPALSGVNLTALNATNLASGTLPAARMPALTGDVTNTVGAVATTISNQAVTLAKMANVGYSTVFYRKSAFMGAPEVNTLATLKTDLGLTGTNSGDQTAVTGNAGTATALQTARAINGVNFDGTAAITVTAAAGTLTGATLASNVLASSLTSVGTLAAVAITGGTINGATVGATTPATGAFTSLSATGITTVASGTALLPSIVSTTGTADTGLWFPAADTLAASTAGSERIRISSTGNVGIGNSSPLFKFTVGTGTINGVNALHNVVVTDATDARIGVYVNNIGASLRSEGTYASLFAYDYTNNIGKTLVLCEYGGNVGIGTASPGAQFAVQVSETASYKRLANFYNTSATGISYITVSKQEGEDVDTAAVFAYSAADNLGWLGIAGDSLGTGLHFKRGGNVGIGTTSPGAQLQVSSGAAGTIGSIIKGAASQTANLTEWQNSSATVLACVTAAGNVGIGTSSPNANAILDVSSTTQAFMPPRMTTTQKNAIASPTAGMLVYDSTLNKLSIRVASAWQTVTSA